MPKAMSPASASPVRRARTRRPNDLREIGPTYHFAPPRVFEALLTRVHIRMEDASAVKRWLFRHFMDVANRWGERIANGEPVPLAARLPTRSAIS